MALFRYLVLLSAILLSGCANFNSIYRTLDIGGYDSRNPPRAVAIDAKQRAIFTSTREVEDPFSKWKTRNVICPEASPDALSAASIGGAISNVLTATTPTGAPLSKDQLQLAIATGEAAASIGLRTQSIQLMRDGMVFNCLMFLNGAATPGEAYALQRRSQNFTLGILAIEQLTGAVKADQAALTATAQAAVGSDMNTEKQAAAIEAARTKQNIATTELETARVELNNKIKDVEAERKKLDDANKAYEAAANSDTTTKAEIEQKLLAKTTQQETFNTKDSDLQSQKIAVNAAVQKVEIENQQVKIAQEALEQATARVRAATSATAFLNASGGRSVLITDKIASTVENIVKVVLDESGKNEMCSTLMLEYLDQKANPETAKKILDSLKTLSCYAVVQQKAATTENPQVKEELKKVLPQLM